MKLYLAGIKSYQLDLGIECSEFTDPGLERRIQGIKRDHGEPDRRTRTPLTRPYLLQILSRLRVHNYENTVLQAAFTLAFAGFLRVGEFTYKGADMEMGPAFAKWFLTKKSVRIKGEGTHMELSLSSSKTDPFRKGITITIAASHDSACPVRAIKRFLASDTHRPVHSPLFCIRKYKQLPFTREYVMNQLQELARGAGFGDGSWNGHSFRRGAATWAAEVGIPETDIPTLGRWRSDAYKAYIEYSAEDQISLSSRFQAPQNPLPRGSQACLNTGTRR